MGWDCKCPVALHILGSEPVNELSSVMADHDCRRDDGVE